MLVLAWRPISCNSSHLAVIFSQLPYNTSSFVKLVWVRAFTLSECANEKVINCWMRLMNWR